MVEKEEQISTKPEPSTLKAFDPRLRFSNWRELCDHGWAIAKILKENPRNHAVTIGRIVGTLGVEASKKLVLEAQSIFSGEGTLIED